MLPVLNDVSGLSALNSVTWLSLDHVGVQHLDGLEQLQTVSHGLKVKNNTKLTDLSALSGVTYVGLRGITVTNNPVLCDDAQVYDVFAATEILGFFTVADNGRTCPKK